MDKHTAEEIAKFDAIASDFWNPEGAFKTLHQINPIRLDFIESLMSVSGQAVADIGCGGGILSEALADKGAYITAIDLSEQGIATAKAHQQTSGSTVDYRVQASHELAAECPQAFSGAFCMEMLEHVKNPESIIADCAALLKPGGIAVFSTLNRTIKAHVLGVIVAEYLLGMVAKGTHDYRLFIKPSELLRMGEKAGLTALDMCGFEYRPFSGDFVKSQNTDINYLFAFKKPVN